MSYHASQRNQQAGLVYGVVVGGHDKDPDPGQNGLARVLLPDIHGANVNKEHLGFSQMVMPPHQGGATEFNGVPDPGQAVLCYNAGGPPGSNLLYILGTFPELQNGGGQPGNISLNSLPNWAEAIQTFIDVLRSKGYKDTVIDGAHVRVRKDGDKHKHSVLSGIPSHGAIYSLAGTPLPQVTNISTAVQSFAGIITGDMLSGLGGSFFPLTSLLSSLTQAQTNTLYKDMPTDVAQALASIIELLTAAETSESGNFMTSGRVDQVTFIENSIALLSQCRSVTDIINVLQRLQTDTTLFGLDKLANNTVIVKTAYGNTSISLTSNGQMQVAQDNTAMQVFSTFLSLMSSGAGFPNSILQNMFSSSSQVMNDMINRLPPELQALAKQQCEQGIASGSSPRNNLNNLQKVVQQAEEVLKKFVGQ
jgi:hypothetical protein